MIDGPARAALENALSDSIRFDASLARNTSLCIGGKADALAAPEDRAQLIALLRLCGEFQLPHTLVGGGFNTLVLDGGVEGVVIQLRRFRKIEMSAPDRLYAGAGASHSQVTNLCIERGLSGLEFAAGIPGTVGGWMAMNAGIGERDMSHTVSAIEVLRAGESETEWIEGVELDFDYRSLRSLPRGSVVLATHFKVELSDSERVRAEVRRHLDHRTDTQPIDVPSCGSVFKNPAGDYAGRLIEAAGLKGLRVGGAQISTLHANFIINSGGATAADVLTLIERARETVHAKCGIRLETEVRILGRAV